MAVDESQKLLSVTDAVKIAQSNLALLIPDAEHILLEEVELSDDNNFWLITLGFNPRLMMSTTGFLTPLEDERKKYRVFKIDRKSREVRSMKIRERENV